MCRKTGTSHFPLSFSFFYTFNLVSTVANPFPPFLTTFLRQLVTLNITGFPNLGPRVVVNTNILNSAVSHGGLLRYDTVYPCRCLLRSRRKTLPLFSESNVGGCFLHLQSHIKVIWTFRRNSLHKSSELICSHRRMPIFQIAHSVFRTCIQVDTNIWEQHASSALKFRIEISPWSSGPSVNYTWKLGGPDPLNIYVEL